MPPPTRIVAAEGVIVPSSPDVSLSAGSLPAAAPRKSAAGKHIPALDGLRGLAILAVLIFHFAGLSYSQLPWALQRVFGAGWVGVDLFFVLSGFLITSILAEAKGSNGYFRNFYMRRVLRIFPLYYGVLIAAAVLSAIYYARLPGDYRTVADHQWQLWVYLQNFVPINWQGFAHFWSLAVEEHFYMVWPAVVFVLSRRGAMVFCVGLIVTAIGVRAVREGMLPAGDALSPAVKAWQEATYTWTICRMDSLAIGALLALAATPAALGGSAKAVDEASTGVRRFRRAAPWVLAAAVVAAGAIFVYRGTYAYSGEKSAAIQVVGFTVNGIAAAALLVIAVTAAPTGIVGRAFAAGWLRFLGKYSYGVYVFHGFVVAVAREAIPLSRLKPMVGGSALAATAVYIVGGTLVSIAIALLSWHAFEKHFLKLKRFFEYRKPAASGSI